jgi:hypothetical protein
MLSENPHVGKVSGSETNYQQRVASALISNTSDAIRQIMADIRTKAQAFADNQDDQGLSAYAGDPNGELSQKIAQVRQQLSVIEQEIKAAENELEDKNTEATIAQYDEEATRFFAQAAELRVDESELRSRKAALIEVTALAEIRKATLVKEVSSEAALAQSQKVEAAALSLRQAYLACLAQGINPLTDPMGTLAESEAARLSAVFYGTNNPAKRAGAAKMAESVSGMLKWAYLLRLGYNRSFLEWYSEFILAVQSNDTAKLQTLGQILTTSFGNQTDVNVVRVRTDTSRNVSGQQFTWFDTISPSQRKEWLAKLPSDWRNNAVAAFRFIVSLDANAQQPAAVLIYGKTYSYYAMLDNLVLTTEPTPGVLPSLGYYFYVVPPENPMSNPTDVVSGLSVQARRHLSDPIPMAPTLAEAAQTRQLEDQVLRSWKELDLSGALGEWTLYILSSPVAAPNDLQQLKNITVHLFMPYISVKH